MQLRPYQHDAYRAIMNAWRDGHRNVLCVLPTGAGKTVLFSQIMHDLGGSTCAIAHRQELVGQISLALARAGVYHRIIGPDKVIRGIVANQVYELGESFYEPSAPVAVAGVDTLVRRREALAPWLATVTHWVMDEAQHLCSGNKWGKAVEMFPHARGLGVTATPLRADGKGLGRHADGVIDYMYVGPSQRDLITAGFLSDYKVFAPTTQDLDLAGVDISKTTGDYKPEQLRQAVRRSHVIGDVVAHYKRLAHGKLGITFATDVSTATDIAARYRAEGIPAEVVSAKTPDSERVSILRRFKNREIMQLVNVDLFGEGFDLPAIEAVSMARPTQSYGLFVQQFGRGLRIMEGKGLALLIDHVGNVYRHGLPDRPRNWTLDRRERSPAKVKNPEDIPVRACPECAGVYERVYKACPYCGFVVLPAERKAPEHVDGDLQELDPATLAAMRGDVAKVDQSPDAYRIWLAGRGCDVMIQGANVKRHVARQEAQKGLRDTISWWGGLQRSKGRELPESQRRFFFQFGTDILSAQALGTADATELRDLIINHTPGLAGLMATQEASK